jgi:hypothetical protein
MALGTITITARATSKAADTVYFDEISVPGDSAYSAGGSAFDAAFQTKMGDSRQPLAVIDIGGVAGYYAVYVQATGKLMVFVRTTGVENATADISAQTFKLLVISK